MLHELLYNSLHLKPKFLLIDKRSLEGSSEDFRKKMSFHLIKDLWIGSRGESVPHVFPMLQVLFDRSYGPSKLCLLKDMYTWHLELTTVHFLSTQLRKAHNKGINNQEETQKKDTKNTKGKRRGKETMNKLLEKKNQKYLGCQEQYNNWRRKDNEMKRKTSQYIFST